MDLEEAAVKEVMRLTDRYTNAISRDLAQVRTACEHIVYDRPEDSKVKGDPRGVVFHLYHCAMVYCLRDEMTPEEAALRAWQRNILGLGVKTKDD